MWRNSFGTSSGRSFEERFDPRENSLAALRLLLALTVLLVHVQLIGWGEDAVLGRTGPGNVAVDGFFVVSGFLVTRSAVRLPTLRRFAWHRALRILPGFWVGLAVTGLLVAPLLARIQGLPTGHVFTGDDPVHSFLLRNALLLQRQWTVAGVHGGPDGRVTALNGSLWTLFYEALCYGAVAVLVAVGVVRRVRGAHGRSPSHRVPLVLAGAVWAGYTAQSTGPLTVGPQFVTRFLLMFLLGALGHLFAGRIVFTAPLLAAAAATALISMFALQDYRPLGAVPLAYLLLWAVVALPLRWRSTTDVSYGLYVFHWPVELLLAEAGLTSVGRIGFTVVALLVTTTLALASWHLVEAPALRLKDAAWVDAVPARLAPARLAPARRTPAGRVAGSGRP